MLHLPTPPAVNLMSSMTPRAWPPRAASLGTVSMLPVYWCLCWETSCSLSLLSPCLLSPRLDTYFHSLPCVVHEHTSLEVKGVANPPSFSAVELNYKSPKNLTKSAIYRILYEACPMDVQKFRYAKSSMVGHVFSTCESLGSISSAIPTTPQNLSFLIIPVHTKYSRRIAFQRPLNVTSSSGSPCFTWSQVFS